MPTLLDYLGLLNPIAEELQNCVLATLLNSGQEPDHEQSDDATHVVVYDEYGPVRMDDSFQNLEVCTPLPIQTTRTL